MVYNNNLQRLSEVAPQDEVDQDPRVAEALLRHRYEEGERELFVPLADLARRGGRLEEARALVEKGLIEFPKRISGWVLAGRIEMQVGRIAQAREFYLGVLEDLDPGNLPALRSLALAAMEEGDSERARRWIERWRIEDPGDREAEDLLAELAGPADAGGGEQFAIAPLAGGDESMLNQMLADIESEFTPERDADWKQEGERSE
jgi:tetratricopeptide (TPR) repeat protein